MGWSSSPPPPDPNIGLAARENAALAREQAALGREQLDWSKEQYNTFYKPAMERDYALQTEVTNKYFSALDRDEAMRRELQDSFLSSQKKQDEYADYQFGRYRDTFAPLEDDLVAEAKRGIDVDGRVNRAVADYSQQSSARNQQMAREANRNNMGNGTAMAYAMAANKNADALGTAGIATNVRAASEGENFARKAAVAGMGRGLVMDTSNFMQGANAAGGAAGNNSSQGVGVVSGIGGAARQGMGMAGDFMRSGYGGASNFMSGAGNSWNNVGQLGVQQSNLAMRGYEADQASTGALFGAVGGLAGMAFGAPMLGGGSFGGNGLKKLMGWKDGGPVHNYADGGAVDFSGEYDPHMLAEQQVNSVMGYKAGGRIARPPKVRPGSTTQRGGKVSGPGGPKEDRVPAMLSDGEFVMPVGTVKKFGLDKLEKMRQDGLQFEKQLGIGRA